MDMLNKQIEGQIRRPVSCLYGAFVFSVVCLLAALLLPADKMIFVGLALFVLL